MNNRPTIMTIGSTVYWPIQTVDPATGIDPMDADDDPELVFRVNGSIVTPLFLYIEKRAAEIGIYDCWATISATEGQSVTVEEKAFIALIPFLKFWNMTAFLAVQTALDALDAAQDEQHAATRSAIPATNTIQVSVTNLPAVSISVTE